MAEKTVVEMYWETSAIAHNAIDKLKELTSGINRVLVAGVGNLLLDNDAEVRRLTQRAADDASGEICGDCLETLPNHLSNCVHVAHRG